ncbi:MAG: 4Fe-4S binding protein, partial [Firmicutes bacterium]|nr:4Fe-4S binding protein [Bacillota bacterium]
MITNSSQAEISLRISPALKAEFHVDVAIVGGGLAGGQVAFDLIQAGLRVAVIEKTPTLGGTALRLDKGYPSDTCSMCMTWNKLLPLAEEKRVTILTNTEIEQVSGKAGSFTLDLRQKPRYVDASKCLACGTCVASCPVQVPDPVNFGLTLRRAIFKPVYGSVPNAFLIDPEVCTRCGHCVETCFTGAIDLSQPAETLRLRASWVVLATGLDSLPTAYLSAFGYPQYPGVITSFEMERLLSEKGPFKGIPVHPTTKTPLEHIAFLWPGSEAPAILSRSPIPSLVTLGEIRSLRKVLPDLQVTIFSQRDTGLQEEAVATLNPAPATELMAALANDPRLNYAPVASPPIVLPAEDGRVILSYRDQEGQEKKEEFDLLVLATDLVPGEKTRELAQLFGLELSADGRLIKATTTLGLPSNESSRSAVFLAGTANGPQTMPQATVDASATAAELLLRLAKQNRSWEEQPETAPRSEIRTGVFICDCGSEIAGVVDTAVLAQYATSLPGVDLLLHHRHLCSPEGIAALQKSIR